MTAFLPKAIATLIYAALVIGVQPAFSDNLTASPSDSMGFSPALRSPASEPVQQDSAQVTGAASKPENRAKTNPTPNNAQPPLILPMPDDPSQAQPPMQNLGGAFQNLIDAQSLGNSSNINSPSATEAGFSFGGFCTTGKCHGLLHNSAASLSAEEMEALAKATTGNACTDKLLRTARRVAQSFGTPSGNCAFAVRKSLNMSGIYRGGGIGHAKDMGPGLMQMGYSNVLKPGMTPDNAPEGAILVYGPARIRGCRGKGSTYGHVEIKDFGGRYLYDGVARRNIQATMGAQCRPLKGVFVPGQGLKC